MERLTVVLDSWAVLALLREEPGADRVEKEVDGGGSVISWINLGEVLYCELRRVEEAEAVAAIEAVKAQVLCELPDSELVVAAAKVKTKHAIAYADCFAIATAERHGVSLITGDPEILNLDRPALQTIDLRPEESPPPQG